MCLGIPGQVVAIADGYAGQVALVDVEGARAQGRRRHARGQPEPGDWVLIHMGFAVEAIDEAQAPGALAGLRADGQWTATMPAGSAVAYDGVSGSCRESASGRSSTSPPRSWPRRLGVQHRRRRRRRGGG